MNAGQALHNAARRYCIDQRRHWSEIYAQMPTGRVRGWSYSAKELDTFPRYNMLNAILVAVETIDAESLDDFSAAKSLVLNAGGAADDDFTRNPLGDIDAAAQSDEREKFCDFVSSLTELDVWNYEELPYRRVLSPPESVRVWSALGSRWGIPAHSCWYPLSEASVPGVVAFRAGDFDESVPAPALKRKLRAVGIERVWELRQHGPEYEEDVELFNPSYNGAEGVWTSPGHEWVLYVSHESSVTVAGTLLSEIKRMWSKWEQHKW
jgi:hypothetical protein